MQGNGRRKQCFYNSADVSRELFENVERAGIFLFNLIYLFSYFFFWRGARSHKAFVDGSKHLRPVPVYVYT